MFKALILTGLIAAFSSSAFAVDLTAPTDDKPAKASAGTNVVPGAEQVDDMITNANLRALSGSKSRWSVSNSITYDGGTISAPFAESRPNIANASATSLDTDINDQISVKYSITPMQAILFGIGIRKMAPFTGSGPSAQFYNDGGKDVDIFDPTLTYQYIYKFFGIQAVTQVGFIQYTRQDIHSVQGNNLDKALSIDQENIYEIGDFSVGASIGVGASMPTVYNTDYSHYQYWLDPYVEYKLSETFNLRTVANILSFEIYQIGGAIQDTYTQSVGVGISVARDIYFYPNIQFLPEHFSKDNTNVGLTATINLF